jgi:hypothetical protein
MGTIEVYGEVYHGFHRGNVGVYTRGDGSTYAGTHEGGQAHGYGVLKWADGYTTFAQYANGWKHGHAEAHCANGDISYWLYELLRDCERRYFGLTMQWSAGCHDTDAPWHRPAGGSR